MKPSPLAKTILFFASVLFVMVGGITFAFLHKEDVDNRVQFSLINQLGQPISHKDYAGQHLLVFFGFTNCQHVCPLGMHRITKIMNNIDQEGWGKKVKPVFISVDPERDSPDQVAIFIQNFHSKFDGLTGSLNSVKKTAESFKTFFEAKDFITNDYDVAHSSMVYIVDPYHRVQGIITSQESIASATERLKGFVL